MKFQISMRSTDGMTDLTLLLPQEGKGCESTHYASPVSARVVCAPMRDCASHRHRVTPSSRPAAPMPAPVSGMGSTWRRTRQPCLLAWDSARDTAIQIAGPRKNAFPMK